jgi:hypothetical protein
MKHYWEVDIRLSKADLGRPWRRYFKVTKVQIERGVSLVTDGRRAHACHRTTISLDALNLQKDLFGAMSRPSQQQIGFLLSSWPYRKLLQAYVVQSPQNWTSKQSVSNTIHGFLRRRRMRRGLAFIRYSACLLSVRCRDEMIVGP